jgi:hypothetical protein
MTFPKHVIECTPCARDTAPAHFNGLQNSSLKFELSFALMMRIAEKGIPPRFGTNKETRTHDDKPTRLLLKVLFY